MRALEILAVRCKACSGVELRWDHFRHTVPDHADVNELAPFHANQFWELRHCVDRQLVKPRDNVTGQNVGTKGWRTRHDYVRDYAAIALKFLPKIQPEVATIYAENKAC